MYYTTKIELDQISPLSLPPSLYLPLSLCNVIDMKIQWAVSLSSSTMKPGKTMILVSHYSTWRIAFLEPKNWQVPREFTSWSNTSTHFGSTVSNSSIKLWKVSYPDIGLYFPSHISFISLIGCIAKNCNKRKQYAGQTQAGLHFINKKKRQRI